MAKQDTISRAAPYRAPDSNHHPVSLAPIPAGVPQRQLLLMGGFCALFLFAGLGIGLAVMKGNTPRQEQSERNKERDSPQQQARQGGEVLDDSLPVVPPPVK